MKKFTWIFTLASIMMPITLNAQKVYTWDFESKEQFNEWTIVDKDGDGFNWQYYNNIGKVNSQMTLHGGDGLVCSASYDKEEKAPLSPDKWMISPEVTLGSVLSFWACGQDIRHYNVTDMYYLNIDDICLAATYIPHPTAPTNLTVTPTATTANVTWDGAEGDSWNLRYKEYNPNEPEKVDILWDITKDNYTTQLADWYLYDMDNDGHDWQLFDEFGCDPTGQIADDDDMCIYSHSWYSKALAPDNWLVSPDLPLGGTFKFWAANDEYPDVLGVFVVIDGYYYQIGEDITPLLNEWAEYTFDTSEYEGQTGGIALRHYNCENQYKVYVDYFSYVYGDDPAPWVEVNGITDTNYTITGLKPGTDYIVEVQSYTGRGETEWTDPIIFTTTNNSITTGMKSVESSNADANTYSVTGVRVNTPSHLPKGIYIIGGKKVVVK